GIRNDDLERRLGIAGAVQAEQARRALRPRRCAEPGQAALRRLPGEDRVPRRGPRQPDRVGRVGRHDGAGASCGPAQAPQRRVLASAVRDRAGGAERPGGHHCRSRQRL
ncbi:MAG: Transcriptional regulator, WhiB family, partial [uncultured Nocardioidaceae bacterium]